ncbi:hypothetical protein K2X05_03860 [bacterium]|nr:hypothetical protein [bacterium]
MNIYKIFAFIFFIVVSQVTKAQNTPQTPTSDPSVVLTYGEPSIRLIEKPKLPVASKNPTLSPQFWAQVGLSYTYVQYAQTLPQYSDLSFYKDSIPAWQLHAGAWFHYHWGLEAYYKTNDGTIRSTPILEIRNGDYRIQSIGAEILYRQKPLLLEQKSETFFKLGIHQHDFPFLKAVSPIFVERVNSSIRTVSLGVETHCQMDEQWRFESWLRYHYPLNSDITPQFTIDGSIGALYRLPKYTSLGVFWTGEWHKYKYSGIFQNIFQSTFDFRLGVEF